MPRRRSVVVVKTEAVQGEDSFVRVRKLTVGEAREVMRDRQRRIKRGRKELAEAGQDRDMVKDQI